MVEGGDKWLLLNRFRKTVKKITVLLNLNITKWKIASMIGGASSNTKRRLSFNDRPGLRAVIDDDEEDAMSDHSSSSNHSGSSRELQRSTSYRSEDDVNKRADLFIANFYRQLHMERQVSLRLRYCRVDSFGSSVSP